MISFPFAGAVDSREEWAEWPHVPHRAGGLPPGYCRCHCGREIVICSWSTSFSPDVASGGLYVSSV